MGELVEPVRLLKLCITKVQQSLWAKCMDKLPLGKTTVFPYGHLHGTCDGVCMPLEAGKGKYAIVAFFISIFKRFFATLL